MQVGGLEVGFNKIAGTHAGDVFRVIKSVWPHARFEDVGDNTSSSRADKGSVEFFVYRNFAASWAINKVGIEDYLQNDFIHVILESQTHDYATIVVGERNEEMESLFRRLESELGWKRHEHEYETAS